MTEKKESEREEEEKEVGTTRTIKKGKFPIGGPISTQALYLPRRLDVP